MFDPDNYPITIAEMRSAGRDLPDNYPITIAEMRSAGRDLDAVLGEEERESLIDWLATNPVAGDIIQGANGVRKVRWSYGAKGKRGGLRIIYYFHDLNMPLYILAAYRKNEKLNITAAEKQAITQLVDELVQHWMEKRVIGGQMAG